MLGLTSCFGIVEGGNVEALSELLVTFVGTLEAIVVLLVTSFAAELGGRIVGGWEAG